jgi:DNA-binding winged helix-turn-helix (wHTH) protein/tetratricopeptide (TPR) repeat protein/TolB-like protein
MESASTIKTSRVTSFDGWVLRADIGELDKDGRKIRLQQRPLLVLEELLDHPGELVTREQLIARLWPKGVVDFDTGLNTAVRKLRVALDDVGEAPRYIETIPRKGYRFLGTIDPPADAATPAARMAAPVVVPVELPAPANAESGPPPAVDRRTGERRGGETASVHGPALPRRWLQYALAVVAALVVGGFAYYFLSGSPTSSQITEVQVQRPVPNDLTIALLPLSAGTTSDSDETLAKVASDVLRQRLNKLHETTVIGAAAMQSPSPDAANPSRFGASVNARYVIDGKLTRQAEQLQLALQIVDVGSGARVWSFEEGRAPGDLAVLVDVAVRGVARHLRVRADSDAQPGAPRPVNLEAYGLYVRASELMQTQRITDGESALELFRRATVLDPQFARAYLGLAQANTFSTGTGALTEDERAKRDLQSLAALDRALALDPGLGEALIERARLTADSAEADRLYREGLRLAPNYGRGYQRYAEFLYDEYRRGEAREVIERAHVMDPLDPRLTIRLAMFRYLIDGDADAHDRLLREVLETNPQMVLALSQLGLSIWLNGGDFAEAIRLTEEAIRIDPDYMEIINTLATMYLDVDDPAAAAAVLESCTVICGSSADLALYQRDVRRAAQVARALRPDDWLTKWGTPEAWSMRDEAMATGDFTPALELMGKRFGIAVPWGPPKAATGPQLQNRGLGLVYAHTLVLAGETQRGRKLAQSILAQLDGESFGRAQFYLSRDRAAAYAILGDKERTLEELKNSLRIGHYSYWWYYADYDPVYENLRADPRFQALVAQVKEHRTRQRALLEELRRMGKVPRRG